MADVSVVLAADVVYDDQLTPHLFRVLRRLLLPHPHRRCYVSLEKRWVFSVAAMAVEPHGYRAFRAEFSTAASEEEEEKEEQDPSARRRPGAGGGKEEGGQAGRVGSSRGGLVGRLVPLSTVPQYCHDYERGEDLELWEIRAAEA